MACELISGIVGVCDYSASGVQKLWLANKDQVTGATYNASGEVTGVTFSGGTKTLYEIQPALDTCTFTDDLQVNGARRNFLQTINFGIGSIDAAILATLEDLGLSNLVAFVKGSDGKVRAFGLKGIGLRATVMTDASGTAASNDGSVAVTIAGTSLGKASFVNDAYAATLGLI
jgi:hypothetical protein